MDKLDKNIDVTNLRKLCKRIRKLMKWTRNLGLWRYCRGILRRKDRRQTMINLAR